MTQTHEELGRRLVALRAEFVALGGRAAGAAGALTSTLPPPSVLLEELSAARSSFTELRSTMLDHAGSLALVLDTEGVESCRDLEPVLAAIRAAEQQRARVVAWEEARESVLVVLDRVMALIHREERGFAALGQCQEKAREMRATLSGPPPDDLEHETKMVPGKVRPYLELIALVDGWNVLDDDRCAYLQDSITQAFSRPLALAALRGKLGREGEVIPPAPAPRVRSRAGAAATSVEPAGIAIPEDVVVTPAAAAPTSVAPATPAAPVPVAPAIPMAPAAVAASVAPMPAAAAIVPATAVTVAPAAPVAPASYPAVAGPMVPQVSAPTPPPAPAPPATMYATMPGAPGAGGGGGMPGAPPGSPLVVEIRLSGDRISVETPEARREREATLERLAQESARWWIAARSGWYSMRERGMTFGDAARDYLKLYPHLLAVPLAKSDEFGGGHLAEGYALLLAHIEKQEEGFVQEALTRLNPQFTTRGRDQSYPLGQELYLYVVAEGRLYKTYPDFVKEVFVNALPKPGVWVQGGVIEADEETRLFTRPEVPGSPQEKLQTLSDPAERTGPHVFAVTTGPLTTRMFTLHLAGATLADPADVEIHLKENGAPSDHAWLLTLAAPGKPQALAPRKQRVGGTKLAELGREFGGLWIAVFNADPNSDKRYELSITLRRKAPVAPPPDKAAAAPAASAASRFFGRKR